MATRDTLTLVFTKLEFPQALPCLELFVTFTWFSDRIALGYEVADLTAELSAAREEGAKTERTCAELSETLEEEREAKGAAEASLSSIEEHQSFLLEELQNDSKSQERIMATGCQIRSINILIF